MENKLFICFIMLNIISYKHYLMFLQRGFIKENLKIKEEIMIVFFLSKHCNPYTHTLITFRLLETDLSSIGKLTHTNTNTYCYYTDQNHTHNVCDVGKYFFCKRMLSKLTKYIVHQVSKNHH